MYIRKIMLYMLAILFLFVGPAYAAPPEITATSAVVIEAKTGAVVFSQNSNEKRAPASTTKIMTALVALDKMADHLDVSVGTSEKAAMVGESSMWLVKGETLRLEDMLYGLLLNSGNDASIAIAEYIGGSEERFVQMMNEKARDVGALQTHFVNPNGLPDDQHYTTATDLAKIARMALQKPKFAEIVATKTKNVSWTGHEWERHLINTNKLLWRLEGANGVKTGYTEKAGHCLVSSATRTGQQFICVVLDSTDVWNDAQKLLEYAFANFERVTLYEAGQGVAETNVTKGMEEQLHLLAAEDMTLVLPKGEAGNLTKKIIVKRSKIEAPIKKGDVVGQLQVKLKGEEMLQKDLMADRDIQPKTLFRSFIKQFWGLFSFMIKNFA